MQMNFITLLNVLKKTHFTDFGLYLYLVIHKLQKKILFKVYKHNL